MQEAAPLAGDTQIAFTYAEVFCKSGAKKREEYGVPRFGANINAGKKVLIKVDGADRVLVCL